MSVGIPLSGHTSTLNEWACICTISWCGGPWKASYSEKHIQGRLGGQSQLYTHSSLSPRREQASPQIPREAACSPLLFPDLVCTMLISGRDVFKLLTRIANLYVCWALSSVRCVIQRSYHQEPFLPFSQRIFNPCFLLVTPLSFSPRLFLLADKLYSGLFFNSPLHM